MEKLILELFKNENGSSPTWDSELSKYSQKLAKKYKYTYNGVYMRDEVVLIPKKDKSFTIINFDLKQNKGTHWIGIIQNENYLYYFDSFGGQPLKEVMKHFKPEHRIIYNNFSVQMRTSAICGDLVLLFFQSMLQYKPSRETYYKFLDIISKHSNRVRLDERR